MSYRLLPEVRRAVGMGGSEPAECGRVRNMAGRTVTMPEVRCVTTLACEDRLTSHWSGRASRAAQRDR